MMMMAFPSKCACLACLADLLQQTIVRVVLMTCILKKIPLLTRKLRSFVFCPFFLCGGSYLDTTTCIVYFILFFPTTVQCFKPVTQRTSAAPCDVIFSNPRFKNAFSLNNSE